MKNFLKQYKKDLIISLIVTLTLNMAGRFIAVLPNAGHSLFSAWLDSLFRYAACITQYTYAMHAGIVFLVVMLTSISFSAYDGIKHMRKYKDILKRIATMKGIMNGKKPVETEKSTAEEGDLSTQLDKLSNDAKKESVKHKIDMVLLGLINLCAVIAFSTTTLIPILLNDSFARASTMIRPYISETDYIQMQSDWTRMKTKEDFNKINEYITKVRDDNNLW